MRILIQEGLPLDIEGEGDLLQGMEGTVDTLGGPQPVGPRVGVTEIIVGAVIPVAGWVLGRMFFPALSAWVGPRMSFFFAWLNLLAFIIAGVGLMMGSAVGAVVGTLISLLAAFVLSLYALKVKPQEVGAVFLAFSMFLIPMGVVVYQTGGDLPGFLTWAAGILGTSISYFIAWRSS